MKDKTIVSLYAMSLIMIMQSAALFFFHIDGVLLSASIAIIAGLAGYEVSNIKKVEK